MSTSAPPTDQQQLRTQIERIRADLGLTVEALAAKADVKARVRAAASDTAGRAKHAIGVSGSKAAGAANAALDSGIVRAMLVKDRVTEAWQDRARRRVLSVAALVVAGTIVGVVAAAISQRRA